MSDRRAQGMAAEYDSRRFEIVGQSADSFQWYFNRPAQKAGMCRRTGLSLVDLMGDAQIDLRPIARNVGAREGAEEHPDPLSLAYGYDVFLAGWGAH